MVGVSGAAVVGSVGSTRRRGDLEITRSFIRVLDEDEFKGNA
jgi:hypothetical protein